MSTAHDLPGLFGEPLATPLPTLRLVAPLGLDFDDAVRRVRPRLHRFAIRRLGDAHEAEELVQEALLRAYTHREQLQTEDDLGAWATVVTGRLVIDRLRVRGRSTSVADVPEGARVGRDTADVVVARDEARTALDALDAMPPRQASVLWAREVEGKSYDEICQQFDMTEPAVRSVLTRARKALRREYALRGGTLPVGGLAVLAPWIAGLTWADKLRRAANRLTAPAVLGAAGIAALGGLVLSPFGAESTPSTSYNPHNAVVVAGAIPAASTTAVGGTSSFTIKRGSLHTTVASAPKAVTRPHGLVRLPLATTCLDTASHNDSSRDGNVEVGGVGVGQYRTAAGSTHCRSAAQKNDTSTLTVGLLPGNQVGVTGLAVASSDLTCNQLPTNPVVSCQPSSAP